MSKPQKKITRKEFLKKSATGLTGLFVHDVLKSNPRKPQVRPAASLEMRVLGRSGIRTSVLGYGAGRSQETRLLYAALDNGINFLDTGRTYFRGNNEKMLGKALAGIRKNVIIQSKMFVRPKIDGADAAEAFRKARKEMEANLQASLRDLRTEYVDILLVHEALDVRVLKNDLVMEFFDSAKKKGLIRAHGFSFHNGPEFYNCLNESDFYDIIMAPFNHKSSYVHSLSKLINDWDRVFVETEFEKAHQRNIGVVVMKTCSGGPYAPEGAAEPTFGAAIRWVTDHPYIGVAIVAMSNLDEIAEAVKACS
jgi:predicted aldo/keto reductase-like oxidoreductase